MTELHRSLAAGLARELSAVYNHVEVCRPAPGGTLGRGERSRTYGEHRLDLAKRAGQRRGWTTGVFDLYGEPTVKRYKTFLATWRPVSGVIRVVLVDEPTGWVAFFCTDLSATVADILTTVAGRFWGITIIGSVASRRGWRGRPACPRPAGCHSSSEPAN